MTSPAYADPEWMFPELAEETSTDVFVDELFAVSPARHLRAVRDDFRTSAISVTSRPVASREVRPRTVGRRSSVRVSPTAIGRIALLVVGIVAMFFLLMSTGVQAESVVPSTTSHLVQPGDTLWDLAIVITPAGGDVRSTVALIRDANGMTSSMLVVGDLIDIPVLR